MYGRVILFMVVLFSSLVHNYPHNAPSKQSPLVIVPGLGGSQAFGRDLNTSSKEDFSVWINLELFFNIRSMVDYFGLTFDPKTNTTKDSPHMKIWFPGWGETWSIENLDSKPHWRTRYFDLFVAQLIKDPFYKSNFTLRGAPYDFRRAPNEAGLFFHKLQSLIEETYTNAGGRRVMLLGHSMGGLYSVYFLKTRTALWKKKYIRGFMSISCPLAGSMKGVKIEASGDNLGVFVDNPLSFRTVQRSMASSAFVLPSPKYWGPNEPIVVTPQKNYTAHNYKEFFEDIKFPEGFMMRQVTKDLVDPDRDIPDVDELHCLYGYNLTTAEQLVYSKPSIFVRAFPNQKPTEVPGDGDGTVNIRSLRVCDKWPGVVLKTFPRAEHMDIVKEANVIEYIQTILQKGDPLDN